MTSGTTPATTGSTWGQRNWDELLSYIEQKSVIPILGPDLVLVKREGRSMTLEQYVALELARRLELPADAVGETPSLHLVMCLYYQLNPDASKRERPCNACNRNWRTVIRNLTLTRRRY